MNTTSALNTTSSLSTSLGLLRSWYVSRNNYLRGYEYLFKEFGNVAVDNIFLKRSVFFHPDHVQHILKTNGSNYKKSPDFKEMKPLLGEGLLTSEGKAWARDRRIVGPEFHAQSIHRFSDIITQSVDSLIREWEARLDATEFTDLSAEMSRLTFSIVGKALLGSELDAFAEKVADAITVAQDSAIRRLLSPVKIPHFVPTRRHRLTRKVVAELDQIVFGIIEQEHVSPVVSRMIHTRDPETGENLPRSVIRDQVMTLMVAGHETTSNALAWTFYLLGRHPHVLSKLRDEVDGTLGGKSPKQEDVQYLPYTRMVLEESMRVFPPVAGLSREAIKEDEIAGVPVKAGTVVEISQWITHKHPGFWRDPYLFIPERFESSKSEVRHPFAYFPFGGGMRACIGKQFALTEAILILAGIVQRFDFIPRDSAELEPEALITLRPKGGVWMKLSRRKNGLT